jgi:hypothetical protein
MEAEKAAGASVGAAWRPAALSTTIALIGALLSGCALNSSGQPAADSLPAASASLAAGPASEPPRWISRNPAEFMRGGAYRPEIAPGDFVSVIDNPYLPLTPGLTHVYVGDGERIEVSVTHETREILEVTTTVVIDRVFAGDMLLEESYDWYAQDRWGNVWNFGESNTDYDYGRPVTTVGSWEAGIDGARPGIVMLGGPRRGDVYRQEFYRGLAEDMSNVVSLGDLSDVPYGSFSDVLVTEDWTPLEPGTVERKMYAFGIGLIVDRSSPESDGSELVEIRDF